MAQLLEFERVHGQIHKEQYNHNRACEETLGNRVNFGKIFVHLFLLLLLFNKDTVQKKERKVFFSNLDVKLRVAVKSSQNIVNVDENIDHCE